jgi:hypothetical protein
MEQIHKNVEKLSPNVFIFLQKMGQMMFLLRWSFQVSGKTGFLMEKVLYCNFFLNGLPGRWSAKNRKNRVQIW